MEKTVQDYEPVKDFLRPNMVVLTHCRKVLLEGVTIQNSPAWTVHPLMCEDLTVRGVYVKNPWNGQNTDGIDVESCKNILLENSTFDVGDDGICIKSGRDEEGRKRGMPTENMVVRGCTVYHAHGGFVIGSEMSGGARNLFVMNCAFIGTDIGLRFKTTRGRGGIVEKIFVKDINMKNIAGAAILFDMYYGGKDPVPQPGEKPETPATEGFPVTVATPQFRDFSIKNIVCLGAERAVFVRGLPEMSIRNISLENLSMQTRKGIEIVEGAGISMKNVRLEISTADEPLVLIQNSHQLRFDGLKADSVTSRYFVINGAKSDDIEVRNTEVPPNAIEYGTGATIQSVKLIQP